MPWKVSSQIGERTRFVLSALKTTQSFAQVCRSFGISRRVGYKWLNRFKQGGRSALADRSRRPHRCPGRIKTHWLPIIRSLRRRHQRWGAKKLRTCLLSRRFKSSAPSVRTIGRYLARLQLLRRRPRRARHGPILLSPPLTLAHAPNDVWTVDFKGRFYTQDGNRAEPLTVRDLFSRYILAIELLTDQRETTVRQAMQRCFKRYGLPRVIRVDNGPPFGGSDGALGLSHLSVWWLRLNIRVEFGRPAQPQDNAAHEQMHRVLKAETANPPAQTVRKQQRRSHRWRYYYNHQRPHEALNQQVPARLYHHSRRSFPIELPPCRFPRHWEVRHVHSKGQIKWQGRWRFIGRAFIGQWVGLKPSDIGQWEIYLGRHLLGMLHERDPGSMRPTRIQRHVASLKCNPCPGTEVLPMS